MIAEEDNLTDTTKAKRYRLVVRSAEEAVRMTAACHAIISQGASVDDALDIFNNA